MQVKYEMLRHARLDGVSKAAAAALFGVSRPTYLPGGGGLRTRWHGGLAAAARGGRSPPTSSPREVMTLIEQHQREGGPLQARALALLVQSKLGISVHPRSIERAVARKKKR